MPTYTVYKSKFTGSQIDDLLTKSQNTTVIANPAGEATETLSKLQVGATIYSGLQGPAGAQGQKGDKGDKGDKGEPGPAGTADVMSAADVRELANSIFNTPTPPVETDINFFISDFGGEGTTTQCTAISGDTFRKWIETGAVPSGLTITINDEAHEIAVEKDGRTGKLVYSDGSTVDPDKDISDGETYYIQYS